MLTLSVGGNAGSVKVYEHADRTGAIILPKTWLLTGQPQGLDITYYVEGVSASGSPRNVIFSLSFTGDRGPCQDVTNLTNLAVHLIHDNANANVDDDAILPVVNVSNVVTTTELGPADGHLDADNFKIDAINAAAPDSTTMYAGTLEALRPDGTGFVPARTLAVSLTRVVGTGHFRSPWIRLVTDAMDQQSMPVQSLLTSADLADDTVEVLGQRIRVNCVFDTIGPCRSQQLVGDEFRVTSSPWDDPRAFDVAVHILSDVVGSVTGQSVRERVNTWVRQTFAQAGIRVRNITVNTIEPVNNYVAISDITGNAAAGDGAITLEIESVRGGQTVTWSVVHNTTPGATPIQTAAALVNLIQGQNPNPPGLPGDRLTASAFENNAIRNSATRCADILISDPMGGTIRIQMDTSHSTDGTQGIAIAQAPLLNGNVNPPGFPDGLLGSLQMRALVRNYDTGADNIDVYVVKTMPIPGTPGAAGYALTRGFNRPPIEHGIVPIRNNVFINKDAADGLTNFRPFTIAHEIGHVLLDAGHCSVPTELMITPTSPGNDVNATKRITDGSIGFDLIGGDAPGSLNQITIMRLSEMLHDD